jgi:hypothetical protein
MSEHLQGDSLERRPSRFSRGHGVALAGLVATVFLYYFDYLTGKAFIWEDALGQYYPSANYFSTAIAEGRFPFWLPGLLDGMPFYTDLQAAIYYPLTWLLVPFAGHGLLPALVYQWYIVGHILLGGGFMYAYLKHHRLAPLACLLGAVIFCFAGFGALRVIHIPMLQVYAWLPLQLLLVDKVVRTRKAKYHAALTVLILLSLLAGFPQTTLYDSCLLIAYWLYRRRQVLAEEAPRTVLQIGQQLGGECLRVAGLFASVLLLAAIQWVPTLEHWRLSPREQWGFQDLARGSMPVPYLIQFVAPNFFGVSTDDRSTTTFWGYEMDAKHPALPGYAGAWQYWEFGAYAGQLSLLALAALAFHRRQFRNTPVPILLVVWVLAAWFMLGRYGGLFQALYHFVPGMSLFRTPSRMASVVDFCSAALVAFFVDAQTRGNAPRLGKPLAGVLILYAAGCACYFAWGTQMFPELRQAARAAFANQQIMISILLFVGTAICLPGMRPHIPSQLRVLSGTALVMLTCADLYHAYGVFHKGHDDPRECYFRNSWIASEHLNLVRKDGPMRLVQFLDGHRRAFVLDQSLPLLMRDLETTRGYVDLVSRYKARFWQLTNQTAKLDLQNVGTVLQRDSAMGETSSLRYHCLPRLGFYASVRRYRSDDEILQELDSGKLNYRGIAAVDAGDLGSALPEASDHAAAASFNLQLRRNSPENYQINYSVDSPGILFVSESYYPGWEAVDAQGKPLQIVRTFVAFKGIVIPRAGQGRITVRFLPRSFLLGAGISATTAVLLGLLCAALIRRERRTSTLSVSA